MPKRKYRRPAAPSDPVSQTGRDRPDDDEDDGEDEVQTESKESVAAIGVKYIGVAQEHVDRLYNTALRFERGKVYPIERATALKMLAHTDTYAEGDIPEGAEVVKATVEVLDSHRDEPPLLNFQAMQDGELRSFARLHFHESLPPHATHQTLIDRLVAFSNRPH